MLEFVNLHNHSEYSLLDGMISPEEMIDFAQENNQPAIAITDHGKMGGYFKLLKNAKDTDVKPIIGCEVYMVEDLNFQENREKGEKEEKYHFTLLAKNNKGLRNLFELTSKSHIEGFYYKPRVDLDMLLEHSEGVIFMSGCIQGVIGQLIIDEQFKTALAQSKRFNNLFQDFYIEIQPNSIPDQVRANKGFMEIHEKTGIPLVATTDAHYLKEQKESHPVLLGINSGGKMWSFDDDAFYLMTGDEIFELFKKNHPKIPEDKVKKAIEQTTKIAEKCEWVEQEVKDTVIPPPYPFLKTKKDEYEYLKELCEKGWEIKNMEDKKELPEYQERLEYELGQIKKLGFVRYFLLVHDLYENCIKPEGIMFGTGRGSAAGSLVCCLLDITTPDPVKYDLMFDRFIAPNRVTSPDIDMDFEHNERETIKQYLIDKYGRDKTSDIGTYGTMKGKQVLRDVGRVFDIPKKEIDVVSKFVIQRSSGDARASNTIQDTFEEFEECRKFDQKHPEILPHAKNLEGRVRQAGVHAAGVVVAPFELTDVMPIEIRGGQDGNKTTALDGKEIDELGFLKLDILGLKTLSVINDAMKEIELTESDFEKYGIDIDFPENKEKVGMKREHLVHIDYNDPKVLDKFGQGDTEGVFQFNSVGMADTLKEMPVESFEDLVSMNALYRPGGMRSGIAHDFIDRRKGKQEIESVHPIYDRITEDTLGLIVYQEQVMKIFGEMANFDAINVDRTRRRVAKSHGVEEMEDQRENFVEGCVDNGVDRDLANDIFTMIVHFGSYGFNRSHAVVYTQIAYWTQWLKVYYPLEFFVASINNEDDDDKVKRLLGALEEQGTELLMPHINKSKAEFSVEKKNGEKAVRCGLKYIKGIGETTSAEIVKHQPYEDEDDIKNREGINRRVFHKGIRKLLKDVGAWKDNYTKEEKEDLRERLAAEELFPFPVMSKNIEKTRELASHYDADFTDISDIDFSRNNFVYLRGIFSGANYARIGDFGKPSKYSNWEVGQRYVMMDLVDGTAHIRVKFNPKKYQEYKEKLRVGQKVLIHGRIIEDIKMVFIDFMVVLDEEKVKEHQEKYG